MTLDQLKFPLCIAHRGVKELNPENTLISFQAALLAKAPVIELDVALSKDRKLIVIHDETLDRTTNGIGVVNSLTLSELKQLDAGSWFDLRFGNQKLPTLQEVMTLVGNACLLNIEIKKEYYEEDELPDSIERQVLDSIIANNLQNSVLISSFEIRILERVRRLNSKIPLAFITLDFVDSQLVEKCRKLNFYSIHSWYAVLTKEQVDIIHASGMKVFSFTINNIDLFNLVLAMGVDGIFTDNYPFFCQRLIK